MTIAKMSYALRVAVLALVVGTSTAATLSGSHRGVGRSMPSRGFNGCAQATRMDSGFFWGVAETLATDTSHNGVGMRQVADVQMADSIAYFGTAAQCDTVAKRYHAYNVALVCDTTPELFDVYMIRIGPNRIIADPRASAGPDVVEFVTLDSTLHIVKVWGLRM